MSAGCKPRPPALLLIGCSRRKAAGLRCGRAWELYDGPLFQILRKALCNRVGWEAHVTVLIVSAKYGVLRADRVIATYDERLTAPASLERTKCFGRQLRTLIAGRRFQAIHVNLGRHYVDALPNLDELFAPAIVDRASGGIGMKNAQTRRWVLGQLAGAVPPISDGTDGPRSSPRRPRGGSHR
jgi:hypothetical protein